MQMNNRITESDYKKNNRAFWMGKKVKTRKELHNGWIKIPQGTIMTIRGKRGGFSLEGEICPLCKIKAVINKVEPTALTLVPTAMSHSRVDYSMFENPHTAGGVGRK
jgi:hypothetical protein